MHKSRQNLDYLDMAFGRGKAKASDFPEVLLHAFDWQAWKTKQRESDLTMPQQASIRQRIEWMLGEHPPTSRTPANTTSRPVKNWGFPTGHEIDGIRVASRGSLQFQRQDAWQHLL